MFAGVGGFEQALPEPDFECVGYSEIDKHAIKTYQEHFTHDNYGDATTIDPAALPDFELLTAGFPCQPFSVAGERQGFDDTRGTLFFDIVRVLHHKRPRNFILENVKGLVSHDQGRTFHTIINTLTKLGYCVEWEVLNAKDLGTPQNRERIIIVGHYGGIPGQTVFPLPRPRNPNTTVAITTDTAIARTLTAGGKSGGNHSGMTVIRQGDTDRRLTITEWERLQGFPDGWTVGPMGQRYKQMGNSVPVMMIAAVVKSLYRLKD